MKYDFCCVGSALVDITFQIDDDFVLKNEERGIPKGAMTLIDKEDQIKIIEELKNLGKVPEKACGGSATNSIVAASLFGSSCYMTCIATNDDSGEFYLEDLSDNGVDTVSKLYDSHLPTGQCLVMVSEDAERTMCTNLGINTIFSASNIDEEIIKVSDSIFIEGYLIASPEGKESFQKAIELAELHNTKVLVSLSDSFIVNSFKNDLKELLSIKCDLVFCNEAEAREFSERTHEDEIFDYFKSYTSNLLVTKGSEGCVGYDQNTLIKVDGFAVNAIDTNGAGDMFAGAVINKLNNGNNLAESAKFGCFAASKIVQEIGPRLSKEGYKKIKESFSSL